MNKIHGFVIEDGASGHVNNNEIYGNFENGMTLLRASNAMISQNKMIKHQVGTKAGDPLGDVIFNCTSSAILHDVSKAAADKGLLKPLPAPPELGALFPELPSQLEASQSDLHDPSFMDDTVFFLWACSWGLLLTPFRGSACS